MAYSYRRRRVGSKITRGVSLQNIFNEISKQWPNLMNLSGGLNLSRGLNMVDST